jgi:hypothetical protein
MKDRGEKAKQKILVQILEKQKKFLDMFQKLNLKKV